MVSLEEKSNPSSPALPNNSLPQRRSSSSSLASIDRHMIRLDVGGTRFVTTWSTLCSRGCGFFKEFLSSSGDKSDFFTLKQDKEGYYFLDRSPIIFAVILEYLRNGKLHYDHNISESQLRLEFKYYNLPFPELNPIVAEVRGDAERYVSTCWASVQDIIANKMVELLNGQAVNIPVGWSHPSIPVPTSKHAITAFFWHCVATYIHSEHGYIVRMKSNGGYTNVLVLYLPVTSNTNANNQSQIENYNIFEQEDETVQEKPKVAHFSNFQPGRQFLHLRPGASDGSKKKT